MSVTSYRILYPAINWIEESRDVLRTNRFDCISQQLTFRLSKEHPHTLRHFIKCQLKRLDFPFPQSQLLQVSLIYLHYPLYLLPRVVFFRPHHTWFHRRRRLRESRRWFIYERAYTLKNTINLPIYINNARKKWYFFDFFNKIMKVFITYVIHIDMKCIICKEKLDGRQRKYCSSGCKNKDINTRHKKYECQQSRGLERKIELIRLMGGCCKKCGYNKNYAALAFHHTDPSKKSITLDLRTLSNNSWAKIVGEANKCVLLCSNCHMEHHFPHLEKRI